MSEPVSRYSRGRSLEPSGTLAGVSVDARRASVRSRLEQVIYSPANYWIMLVVDLAGAAAFLALGVRLFEGDHTVAALAVGTGLVSWSGLEYAVHRWVLHGAPSVVQRTHARHHREPAALISAPLLLSTSIAFGLWAALCVPLTAGTAAFAMFGLYAGYNGYVVLHHIQHHYPALVPLVPGLRALERAHLVHHQRYIVNYGVTSTWWDHVFASDAEPGRLRRARAERRQAAVPVLHVASSLGGTDRQDGTAHATSQ